MKIPKKVDILGDVYKVEVCKNVTKVATDKGRKPPEDGQQFVGYFNMRNRTIYIDAELVGADRGRTLFHEMLEILTRQLVVKISHDDIERLEHGLFYVLEKNKLMEE